MADVYVEHDSILFANIVFFFKLPMADVYVEYDRHSVCSFYFFSFQRMSMWSTIGIMFANYSFLNFVLFFS
jgi:hypothetical protein